MNAKKLTALLISVFMLLQMCVISVSAETDSDTAASDIVTETDESSESGDAAETEASAITAATDRGAVANAEAGTITVDGSKDDAYASVMPIEVKYIDDVPVADLTDGTANVYLMTNNGLLYVYGEINDTNPLTPDAEAQANWPWDTDSLELFIDPNGDGSGNVYQFRVDNSGYPSFYMNWNGVMSAYGPEAAKDYFVSYADGERDGGYTVEFCIDLKNFGVSSNTKLGINFQLNDRDSDENGEISQRAIYNGIAGSFDSYDYDYVTIGAGETYEAVGEPVPSSGTCGENLTWTLVDGVLTISGTGDMYDYDSTHWDYYPNVEPAPWQGQTVTSIVVESGVTSIGTYAFESLHATYVTISGSVKNIKRSAFEQNDFEVVIIPQGVEEIGINAFGSCSKIKSISISDTVKNIERFPFDSRNLTEFIIDENNPYYIVEDSVVYNTDKTILYMAIPAYTGVIVIPDTVTTIYEYAFRNSCAEEIVVPNSVTSLYFGVFSGVRNIRTLVINEGVTSFVDDVSWCDNLEAVVLPASLEKWNCYSLYGNPNLKSVYFMGDLPTQSDSNNTPHMLTSNHSDLTIYYFDGAEGFTEGTWTYNGVDYKTVKLSVGAHLPFAVSGIASTCTTEGLASHWKCLDCGKLFADATCTKETTLEALTLLVDPSKHGETEIRDAVASTDENDGYTGDTYCIDCDTKIADGMVIPAGGGMCGENLTWTLVDGVLTISGTGDMYDYKHVSWNSPADRDPAPWYGQTVTSIIIEDGVTNIGEYAFSCMNVEDINIAGSVKVIENGAFANNYSLKNIIIPEGAEELYGIFTNCGNLESISIPSTVKVLEVFPINNWVFDKFIIASDNPYFVSDSSFVYNADKTELIYCLAKSGSVVIPETVIKIEDCAFEDCMAESIKFEGSVPEFGSMVFRWVRNIKTLELPEGVTRLSNDVAWCDQLEKLILPTTLESIDTWSIRGNSNLKHIYFKGNAPVEESVYGSLYTLTENHADLTLYYNEGAEGWTTPTWEYYGVEYNTVALSETEHNIFHATEIKNAVAVTDTADGYTGDTYCIDCDTKIADGMVIPAGGGMCGDDLVWGIKDGVLTISGTGKMYDYDNPKWNDGKDRIYAPWYGQTVTSLIIENGVTSVGNFAFYECDLSDGIQIASTVKTIGAQAFAYANFSEVMIPEGVEELSNDNVFTLNYNLTSISLPSTLKNFSGQTFNIGRRDVNYILNETNPYYKMIDNCIYNSDITELVFCCECDVEITLPETVSTIRDSAIRQGVKLDKANNNTVIGDYANFKDEITIIIPENVVEIGSWSENYNRVTQNMILPATLKTIGVGSFQNMNVLTSLYFKGNAPALEEVYYNSDPFLLNTPTVTVFYNEGATGFDVVDGKWTTSQGVTVNAVEIPAGKEFQPIVHVMAKESTCNVEGNAEHWYCAIRDKYYTDAACTVETTFEALTLPVDPSKHGETEIRDAAAATENTDGYTGDTWCLDCNEKIADGQVIPADTTSPDVPSTGLDSRQNKNVVYATPEIDGVLSEGEWSSISSHVINADNAVAWAGETISEVVFHYAWDDEGFYLAADVEDEDICLASGIEAVYNLDAVQIALDPAGLIGAAELGGGMFFSIGPMEDGALGAVYHPYGGAAEAFDYTGAYNVTDNGWQFEIMIPWTSIEILADDGYAWTHEANEIIHALFCVLDRDENGEVVNCYTTAIDELSFSPSDYPYALRLKPAKITDSNRGNITQIDASAISVDGQMNDAAWEDALTVAIDQFNVGEETGTHGTAHMLWDDNIFYIYYDITDADIVLPSEDMQKNQPWNTDSVEMFFDFGGNHEDLVQQFRVDVAGWLSYYSEGGADYAYGPDANAYFGDYAVSMDVDGYNIEAAVNLEKWGLNVGDKIGLQLQINDMTAANENSTTAIYNMAQSRGAGSWDADLYDYVVLADKDGSTTPVVPGRGLVYTSPFAVPTVDGVMDDAWQAAEWTEIDLPFDGSLGSVCAARAKVMHDKSLLYFLVEVADATPTVGKELDLTAQDAFEIYIDEDLCRRKAYCDNAVLFGLTLDGDIREGTNANGKSDMIREYVVGKNDNGYVLEFSVALQNGMPADGNKIGLEFMYNDCDENGTFLEALRWNADTANGDTPPWQAPECFGELVIGYRTGEMLGTSIGDVPYIKPNRIIIDGEFSSVWDNAATIAIDQFNYGDENASTRGTAYMYWTDGKWYLFVDVKDADVTEPDPEMQQYAPWQTDSVEMFFDFGHAHSALVKQFRLDCSGYPSYYEENGNAYAYGEDAKNYFDEYAVKIDDDGYNVEMVINLSQWGLNPGDEIGLQLQINDVISSNPTEVYSCWNMHQSMGAGSWDADLYDYVTLEEQEIEEVVETPVEIPAADNTDSVSVKVEDAVLAGDSVTINEVDETAIENAFTDTSAESSNTVTIDVSNVTTEGSDEAETVQQITIPTTVVDTIKESAETNNVEDAKLAVQMSTGSIILDKSTLDLIASKAATAEEGTVTTVSMVIDDADDNLNEVQVTALADEIVYGTLNVSMEVATTDADGNTESESIHDFEGGTVQLEVPFEVPEGMEETGFTVYYLDEAGKLVEMDTEYVDGKIVWTTDHFSDYIILYREPTFPLGDTNHDGKADSSDAVAILRKLAGYDVPNFYNDTADFNGDGKADSSDAVAILRKLAGY